MYDEGNLVLIILLLIFILFLMAFRGTANAAGTERCVERFGTGWEHRFNRGPDFCVNSNGDVKIL